MAIKERLNIIAVKKGTTVFPGGQNIYISSGGQPSLAVQEGQFVAYDPKTNISLDATSIADVDTAVFAVGWKKNYRTGYANELRKLFNEETRKCDLVNGTAEPFKCGTAAVSDLLFKCIKPDEVYTIRIEVEDWESESFRPEFLPTRKIYTVNTHEATCDAECEPVYECGDLVDKLIDQINGITETRPMDGALGRVSPERYQPFFATKLFDKSTQFCLDPQDSSCNVCTHLPAITGITVGETTTTFENTVDPENTSLTLKEQLESIRIQANAALVDSEGVSIGSLTYTGGAGQCCPTQIEINTSEETIQLLGEGGTPIEPCGTSTPIEEGYNCGIRVTAKHLDLECLCEPSLASTYIKNKHRKVHIEAVGKGWACNSVKVNKVQNSTVPKGWGYDLIEADYQSQTGGTGRAHEPYNEPRGRFNTPSDRSRAMNTGLIDCKAGYCQISLESRAKFNGAFERFDRGISGWSVIAIDQSDTDNILDVQEIVNAFIADTSCPIFKTLECVNPGGDIITPDVDAIGVGGVDTTHGFPQSS